MKGRGLHRVGRSAGLALGIAVGLPVTLAPGLAPAQGRLNVPRPVGDVAELPDLDAIERGARPRASRSFAPAGGGDEPGDYGAPSLPPAAPRAAASARPPAGGETTITRLQQPGSARVDLPGGIYGLEGAAAPPEGDPSRLPSHHVVQSGDTLWSLCDSYYRDPWQWPRLWSMNPQVTNPHWIFPGDVVKLHDGASPAGPGGARPASGGAVTFKSNRPGTLGSRAVLLRELGFIEANALAGSAQIAGSREEKIMLATGDQAYVSFTKEQPLKAGERYTIFAADKDRPVKNPENGQTLGYLVRVLGDLVVDQIAERNMARGTLVDLVEPVERGATVSPFIRQFKRLEPQASQVNLEARVLAAFSPANMLAAETFVVLGRGRKDGVEVGNRSFVVRRGDGYRPVMEAWDTFDGDFPKEVVGELWVVDVRENSSIAWIARSTKEIRVGEITELRKGH